MSSDLNEGRGRVVPFPNSVGDRAAPWVQPTRSIHFSLRLRNETDGLDLELVTCGDKCQDDIGWPLICEVAELYDLVAIVTKTVKAPSSGITPVVVMTVDSEEYRNVGPAISQIVMERVLHVEKPSKYERPHDRVPPELLRAMMRSHFAILSKEAAEAEMAAARAELHEVEEKLSTQDEDDDQIPW